MSTKTEARFRISAGFRGAGTSVTLSYGTKGTAIEQWPNGRISVTGFLPNRDAPADFTLFYDIEPRNEAAQDAIAAAKVNEERGRQYAADLIRKNADDAERQRVERVAKEKQRALEMRAIEYHPRLVQALRYLAAKVEDGDDKIGMQQGRVIAQDLLRELGEE